MGKEGSVFSFQCGVSERDDRNGRGPKTRPQFDVGVPPSRGIEDRLKPGLQRLQRGESELEV